MTIQDVAERIAKIANSIKDPEMAHHYEDELYRDVLRAIADGTCDDPAMCARMAVSTGYLDFPRWCA